ncbi:BamA/TamA family outer membrane protein [Flavobacterium sp.]|uniref:BamA/TamA family outer membrane protein n=1 Tax=Flavobacterium sp. TaxID=239 RepID=UPI0025C654C1|nr:BamA/TamA family outer membrane protein [Flavobacterium sp.]
MNYNSNHKNTKSISDETIRIYNKLSKIGFIENHITDNIKVNDSSYITKLTLGKKIKTVHIYIGRNNELHNSIAANKTKDTITILYEETEAFLNNTLQKLEHEGFTLAKLKLINIQHRNQTLYADLEFTTGKKRKLNTIEIKYLEKNNKTSFPKGYITQINHKYQNKTFNQNIVDQIHNEFEKFKFVSQVKYPEILLTKDTTKIYVYLEKRKSNTFDGFIGFSNNENKKTTFNGYLDINLENTLQVGEQFSLYWKSDGNKQKIFKTSIELPYLFKSPIQLKANLTIFKQDSTYQNTKTEIDLGYFINYNTRIYLGYQSTESSDIQNSNNDQLSDYKNSFLTSNFEYTKNNNTNFTSTKKTTLSLTIGLGKRNSTNLSEKANKQFYINLEGAHNFYLNTKNSINIKSQNYYLQSDAYIINELFRFGGFNSIRGFEENRLQAHFLTLILTEYRYALSPNLYIHSIIDYGTYKDQTITKENNQKKNLTGLGLGLGLQTKNGLLKLALANGSVKNKKINFYNTIVNICYNVKF